MAHYTKLIGTKRWGGQVWCSCQLVKPSRPLFVCNSVFWGHSCVALSIYWTQFTLDYKQFLFSLRENCERVILITLLQFSLHALESFYHTEILLHVLIKVAWISLTEKNVCLGTNKLTARSSKFTLALSDRKYEIKLWFTEPYTAFY